MWWIPKSYSECVVHYSNTIKECSRTGKRDWYEVGQSHDRSNIILILFAHLTVLLDLNEQYKCLISIIPLHLLSLSLSLTLFLTLFQQIKAHTLLCQTKPRSKVWCYAVLPGTYRVCRLYTGEYHSNNSTYLANKSWYLASSAAFQSQPTQALNEIM